jgi:predicted GTPase/uncharacterized protein (DUF697 family)
VAEPNWAEVISSISEQMVKDRGNLNIIIAGRSGVGKSTLINAMFQDNLASTGQGKPVTQEIREYSKEGVPITIFDTRGLEMEKYQSTTDEVVNLVATRAKEKDLVRHIHIAWVCVSEESRRVEDGEIHLVERLSQLGLPVIAVVTKARSNQDFDQHVQCILPDARQVVRVHAKQDETDDDGHMTKQMGLNNLLEVTSEVVPDGLRNALSAAQKVSIAYKVTRAQKVVATAVASAAVAVAIPMPIADATALVTVQSVMVVGVSLAFGLQLSSSFVWSIMSSVIGNGVTTFIGKTIVANLLDLVPGGGIAAAIAVKSATAISVTTALGAMYIGVLSNLFNEKNNPSLTDVKEAFRKKWSSRTTPALT